MCNPPCLVSNPPVLDPNRANDKSLLPIKPSANLTFLSNANDEEPISTTYNRTIRDRPQYGTREKWDLLRKLTGEDAEREASFQNMVKLLLCFACLVVRAQS